MINLEYIAIGMLGFVAITEWILIITFKDNAIKVKNLTEVMKNIDKKFEAVETEAREIKEKLMLLYAYAKTLGTGTLNLKGDVPMIGKIDINLELGKKDVKS